MLFARCMTIAAAVLLSSAAFAEQNRTLPDPANPHQTASAPIYQSAFADYQPAPAAQESPDKNWRAANVAIAGTGGMAHQGHGAAVKPPAEAMDHDMQEMQDMPMDQGMHGMPMKKDNVTKPAGKSVKPMDHSMHDMPMDHGGHTSSGGK